jgi:7-cyano-7-deazaguanine reductase
MTSKQLPLTNEHHSELGKVSPADDSYNPKRLFPIARLEKRLELGIEQESLPFYGFDYWNHYEVSWLNEHGKPMIGIAEIIYNCHSPFIIESKSLKLYFNSLNNSIFKTKSLVEETVKRDLSDCLKTDVSVTIHNLKDINPDLLRINFTGESIDDLDVRDLVYYVEPDFLSTHPEQVDEILYSDLLKSNCLVTNQPDWGSVQISYQGAKIDREGLLKYLISFRNHNEFHEQCIERIFIDIMTRCKPKTLSVYGRYTRRGGLDINPYRTSDHNNVNAPNLRLIRQ